MNRQPSGVQSEGIEKTWPTIEVHFFSDTAPKPLLVNLCSGLSQDGTLFLRQRSLLHFITSITVPISVQILPTSIRRKVEGLKIGVSLGAFVSSVAT